MVSDDTWKRPNVPRLVKWAVAAGCAIYIVAVAYLLFESAAHPRAGSNLVPFRTIRAQIANGGPGIARQLIGNSVLLAPIGFTASIWGVRLRKSALAMLVGAVLVEIVQIAFQRVPDIDDVILNVVGGVAGAGIGWLAAAAIGRLRARSSGRS